MGMMGGGGAAYTSFLDSFGGALTGNWNGATWSVADGKVLNTPSLGTEALTDGGAENWTTSTNLTSWSEYGDGGNSVNQEETDKHGGNYSAKLSFVAGAANCYISQSLAGQKKYYHVDYWEKVPSGKQTRYTIDAKNSDDPNMSFAGTGDWVNRRRTVRTTNANTVLRYNKYNSFANGTAAYFDDASAKILTDSQLALTRPIYATADYLIEATISAMEIGTMAGMVICVDNPANPQNYVVIYHNGQTLWAKKVLSGGDYATIGSKVQTFAAGDRIKVAKLGDQLKVYLNDVAISTAITLDAALKDNLYAGVWSTYSGNLIDSWSEQVKRVGGSDSFLTPFFSGAVGGAIFAIGDSITAGATDEVTGLGYPPILAELMAASTRGHWREITPRAGHGGYDILDIQNVIDTDLAATSGTPTHVLILLGANDIATAHWPTFTEATWKADYQYCIDAVHTKWSSAIIYLCKSYRAGNEPNPSRLTTLAGWIDDLVMANPGVCVAGSDLRDIFTGHQSAAYGGAEPYYLVDDVHPNHLGFTLLAQTVHSLIS